MKTILFPDGLETIGVNCFSESGLEAVTFPTSIRNVAAGAFYGCRRLRDVRLNENLEKLGERETVNGDEVEGDVFTKTAIENI